MGTNQELNGPKLLRSWLAETGYTQLQAAKLFMCDPSLISHMLAGRYRPGLQLANRIAVHTDGAVAQISWTDPADLLPQDGSEAA